MTGYKQRKKVKKNGLEDFLPADFRGLARMKSKRLGIFCPRIFAD